MTDRFPDFLNPAVDSNGDTLAGAQLFFYRAGTSTKKDTYSDSAKTIANANPLVADAGGRFGDVFMLTDEQYKAILAPAGDTDPPGSPIDTWDFVSPVLQPGTFPIIAVSSKSSNYTVLETDRGADILADASSGPATITLLPASTAASGFVLTIVKTDSSANLVTVDGNLAETINGTTTVDLGSQFDAIEIGTEGTFWYIKSEKRLPTPAVGNADEIVAVNSAGTGFTTSVNPLPPGHITGLTLSNNVLDATDDIDIAAGKARDDADTANLIVSAAIGKQLTAPWAAGGTPGATTGGFGDPQIDGTATVTFTDNGGSDDFVTIDSGTWTVTPAVGDIMIVTGGTNAGTYPITAATTTQIDVATGSFLADAGSTSEIRLLQNGATYHVFLGEVSGVAEVGLNTSETAADLVADYGFTNTRRIGSVLRGTATNLAFKQDGDNFWLVDRILDVSDTTPGLSANVDTVTVPTGIEVVWLGNGYLNEAGTALAAVTSLFETDAVPSSSLLDMQTLAGSTLQNIELERLTNTSGEIRYRSTDSAVAGFRLTTRGWRDRRGRDG